MDISVNLFGNYSEDNQTNNEIRKNQSHTKNSCTSQSNSESSKFVVSRKNILTERNEELNFEKSPGFDLNPSLNINDQKSILSSSSSKPYNPLTNYLLPRPKFLRYNPDRHICNTLLSPDNESVETENGYEINDDATDVDVAKRGSFHSKSDEEELEEDEIEDSGDEYDASEDDLEEKGWNLKGLLKAFIVLVALFLLADYVSNMNSPPTQPVTHFEKELCIVRNPLVDAMALKCIEDRNVEFVDKLDETEVRLLHLNERVNDKFDENMGLVQGGEIEDVSNHEMDVNLESQEKVESLVDHVTSENDAVNGELSGEMKETFTEGYEENGNMNDEGVTLETTKVEESNPKLTINWVVEQTRTSLRSMSSKSISVGICTICLMVALLALGSRYKFKRTLVNLEAIGHQEQGEIFSTSTMNPCSMRSKSEKNIIVEATKNQESSEKIESFATPSTLIYPLEEQASKEEYYETRAPRVELLGEFEVGEISSSSIKSYQKKSSRMVESDLSNYSISREEISSWSKPRQRATPKQSLSEYSFSDSPSYGSFTAEKKRQPEVILTPVRKVITTSTRKVITTTPVRRSNRIQHRAALSP